MTSRCSSGCPTQDCPSYGYCLKHKAVKTVYANSAAGRDFSTEKAWNKELDLYAQAKAQGIQPASTRTDAIRTALDLSDHAGTAFDAGA